MSHSTKQRVEPESEPVRVLGRGLRAERGVHLTIRVLREAAGKTQVEVATESEINQADISRLEGRADFNDCQVSTLRRYIAALGGELELVARFGNKRIILAPVEAARTSRVPASKPLQRTSRRPARR